MNTTATATRTRIELKNVLFATDLSDAASAAIPYAKEIAKRYEAHLFVLHVRPPVVNPMTPPQTWVNVEEAAKSRRRKAPQGIGGIVRRNQRGNPDSGR